MEAHVAAQELHPADENTQRSLEEPYRFNVADPMDDQEQPDYDVDDVEYYEGHGDGAIGAVDSGAAEKMGDMSEDAGARASPGDRCVRCSAG